MNSHRSESEVSHRTPLQRVLVLQCIKKRNEPFGQILSGRHRISDPNYRPYALVFCKISEHKKRKHRGGRKVGLSVKCYNLGDHGDVYCNVYVMAI